MTTEITPGRRLTYREVGDLLGLTERAALAWVKRYDLPTTTERPARVAEADVRAKAAELGRALVEGPPVATPSRGEAGAAAAPEIAAEAGVNGALGRDPQAIPPASAAAVPDEPLAAQWQRALAEIADLARRNESLGYQLGRAHDRLSTEKMVLRQKDDAIAENAGALLIRDKLIAVQQDLLAAQDKLLAGNDAAIADLSHQVAGTDSAALVLVGEPGPAAHRRAIRCRASGPAGADAAGARSPQSAEDGGGVGRVRSPHPAHPRGEGLTRGRWALRKSFPKRPKARNTHIRSNAV